MRGILLWVFNGKKLVVVDDDFFFSNKNHSNEDSKMGFRFRVEFGERKLSFGGEWYEL